LDHTNGPTPFQQQQERQVDMCTGTRRSATRMVDMHSTPRPTAGAPAHAASASRHRSLLLSASSRKRATTAASTSSLATAWSFETSVRAQPSERWTSWRTASRTRLASVLL
jgi:hypothetical protein